MARIKKGIDTLIKEVFSEAVSTEKCTEMLTKASRLRKEDRLRVADSIEQWLRVSILVVGRLQQCAPEDSPFFVTEEKARMFIQLADFIFNNKGEKSVQSVKLLRTAAETPIKAVLIAAEKTNNLFQRNEYFLDTMIGIQDGAEMSGHLATAAGKPEDERIYIAEALEGILLNVMQAAMVSGDENTDEFCMQSTLGYGPANAALFAQFIVDTKGKNTWDFVTIYAEKSKTLPEGADFSDYKEALYTSYRQAEELQKKYRLQKAREQKKRQQTLIKKAGDARVSTLRQLRPPQHALKKPFPGK